MIGVDDEEGKDLSVVQVARTLGVSGVWGRVTSRLSEFAASDAFGATSHKRSQRCPFAPLQEPPT
jgi:hypothetical protein